MRTNLIKICDFYNSELDNMELYYFYNKNTKPTYAVKNKNSNKAIYGYKAWEFLKRNKYAIPDINKIANSQIKVDSIITIFMENETNKYVVKYNDLGVAPSVGELINILNPYSNTKRFNYIGKDIVTGKLFVADQQYTNFQLFEEKHFDNLLEYKKISITSTSTKDYTSFGELAEIHKKIDFVEENSKYLESLNIHPEEEIYVTLFYKELEKEEAYDFIKNQKGLLGKDGSFEQYEKDKRYCFSSFFESSNEIKILETKNIVDLPSEEWYAHYVIEKINHRYFLHGYQGV